jgi:Protein of unknown function (DUF3054)
MSRRVAVAAVLDVVAIVVFVVLGRRNHDETTPVLTIAAPFLIAVGVGWLVARAWRAPMALNTGVIVWVVTLVVGMLLRRFAFDRGTALSFIIVATVVLGVFLLGWRAVTVAAVRSRHVEHA